MILTSDQHVKHPFVGQNTQLFYPSPQMGWYLKQIKFSALHRLNAIYKRCLFLQSKVPISFKHLKPFLFPEYVVLESKCQIET